MDKQKKVKILVVDDEKTVRDFLLRLLKTESVEVKAVEGGFQAIEAVKAEEFDLVFLDIRMPDLDGIRAYAELRKIDPEIQCVFMTGYALEENFLDKMNQQSVVCLKKPFQDIVYIKNMVRGLLENKPVVKADSRNLSERRIYKRLDITLQGIYKVLSKKEGGDKFFVKNISPGGVKVLLPEALSTGTTIELSIQFMGNKICKAAAKVIWNKEFPDKTGFYETGISFTEVNLSELADCLGSFVSFSAKKKVE